MPAGHDTIVVGLGGMGSAAAATLAGRGRRVLGLDRFGPAHDRGSSHGESRMVRQAYFERPGYLPLIFRAYELWRDLADERGRPLLQVTGGLTVGQPDSQLVTGVLESARLWDLPVEQLSAAELRRRFPTFTPGPELVGVYDPRSGFVRPEATVQGQLRRAREHGADLRFGQRVRSWSVAAGGAVQVDTADGVYTADSLVLAPGAWASELLPGLDVHLTVERQVQVWFAPRGPLERFAAERHPVYVWETEPAMAETFYGFPAHPDLSTGLKVAFHHGGVTTTADSLDRSVGAADVDRLRAVLATRVPDLAGELIKAQVCMYTNTPDGHFVLATHPRYSNVAVACGFSGHGFKFVPVVGEILADLAIDGTTRHDIGLFDPARFAQASPG
jgi:sarcosine oxidase